MPVDGSELRDRFGYRMDPEPPTGPERIYPPGTRWVFLGGALVPYQTAFTYQLLRAAVDVRGHVLSARGLDLQQSRREYTLEQEFVALRVAQYFSALP